MEANGIVLSPDPRLRQECAVIEEITPAIEALAEKMKKMMFENGGCGLAAPQIGELIQLVTIDCDYSDKNDYDPYVLINPVIVEQSDHLVPFSEGCLSIPGISCEIERPDHVVVEAYDLDANLIRYEASGDLFCVCLQHEIDHLHGNTMFERLKPMQRLKAVKEYQDDLARGARLYLPVLKHSRCAAKLRAGRDVGAQHRGLRCSGSVRPGAVGPGMGVFADRCFAERAAFIAALSLVLGIFVLVELLLRMGWVLGFPLLFVAVSALVEGRRSLCVLSLWVRLILLCLR